jgi:hypothetical protein
MSIASLPPSNHIGNIRRLLDRLRRNHNTAYGIPTLQELQSAQDSLTELERIVNPVNPKQ